MYPLQNRRFNGFVPESLQFLKNLKKNNSKAWFEKNRIVYKTVLLTPFKNLVMDLIPDMLVIDQDFIVEPAINKTISKIYRDTRFSKDKSLFKERMWFIFKRSSENWKEEVPGFFFELSTEFYRYGMGFYNASKKIMDAFRSAIDNEPANFLDIISFLKKRSVFQLAGEKYKRIIPNNQPAEIQDWYQRKTFYLVCNKGIDDDLFSPKLLNILITDFNLLAPLYHFTLDAKLNM